MSLVSGSGQLLNAATSPVAARAKEDRLPFAPRSNGVTWRSVLLGTLAVAIVCGLTPYNDFVLSDTSFTAGYLPLSAVLILFVLVVGINAPLHYFAPRHALAQRELAVIVLMSLL